MIISKATLLNWSGPVILLLAYGLLSAGIIAADYIYQLLNIVGSMCIIASLWKDKKERMSLIVFNVFWIVVALIGIFKSISA